MSGLATRLLPYALAFTSSLCIMILELTSSRLVARHVGASLTVWTSVIGIILGGICLGNVLGGRLADRVAPRRAVGPLFALAAFLTLFSLWMNAEVGHLIPGALSINWELRTVLVVTLDFLVPATVLGMVGPVVAKMAVEQARKAGSAIGDVYFWGAIGSIVGTFLTGFGLMYLAPSSTTVLVVAAVLALLAAGLIGETAGVVAGLLTALLLGLGSIAPLVSRLELGGVDLGSYKLNYLVLAGNAAACVLAFVGLAGLVRAPRTADTAAAAGAKSTRDEVSGAEPRPSLADLAVLAFAASLVFMALEMVAGRLVQRHLGSGIYGWTSVIGVLLAGLSFGNFLGGKIADFVKSEKQASWLLLAASILILGILVLETQPTWLADHVWGGEGRSLIGQAIWNSTLKLGPVQISMNWPFRILFVVTAVFLLPALTLGTVSPVVAKLAVDRLRRYHRTGTAIGQVYAWGMVGSIIGTFLTGFLLIDTCGTKGVILILGTTMALGATMLGSIWHAIWAGIPLGLCVLAFTPPPFVDVIGKRFFPLVKGVAFKNIGDKWGIREQTGDPNSPTAEYAWIDESNYYYIKINNEPELSDTVGRYDLRLMSPVNDVKSIPTAGESLIVVAALDNVLHFRIFDGSGKMIVDTDEKKLTQGARLIDDLRKEVESLRAPHELTKGEQDRVIAVVTSIVGKVRRTLVLDNLIHGYFILGHPERLDYDYEHIYALVAYRAIKAGGKVKFKPAPEPAKAAPNEAVKPPGSATNTKKAEAPKPAESKNDAKGGPTKPADSKDDGEGDSKKPAAGLKSVQAAKDEQKEGKDEQKTKSVPNQILTENEKNETPEEPEKEDGSWLPAVENSSLTTLFLGGGAYCFQRHMQFAYPGTAVDVAEIDPAVTNANFMATGLPRNTEIRTYWGDARQFVELHQDTKKYDLVFGDAFNDFSVPWHLTTREFNEKIKKMLTPTGVYMINIIDAYMSDAEAEKRAEQRILADDVVDPAAQKKIHQRAMAEAYRFGGFVGAWTRTAKLTFPHVYIFGTDAVPGGGDRETFVVVASNQELDLKDLGRRVDDPRFYKGKKRTEPKPYAPADEQAIELRSRKIILTDDYAPVDNLLAPVAETRGNDDD